MQTQPLTGAWQFHQAGSDEWLPATVPGGVHTDLLALGRIPDPFVGDNERRVAWVAEADWEYRRTFDVDAALLDQPHIELVCDGLDTLAAVTLNGRLLGRTDNMYRQYRWDVSSPADLLRPTGNELVIYFASTVRYAAEQQAARPLAGVSQAIAGGPHVRKAPCQFGWDWGPQLPPVGIWQDIRLEGFAARLGDVHLRQHHAGGRVTVSAAVTVEGAAEGAADGLLARLVVTAPGGMVYGAMGPVQDGHGELAVEIENPQLWWPNGHGAQPLYDVHVELVRDGGTLDQRTYRLGLRTLELRQEPDQWGRSFEFVVNGGSGGGRIFAKGANWIPADSFPTRITRGWLETLLRAAVASHQNMLRVWGGGFYESDDFYDLCDELGILLWQDCIFSCSIYPLDDPAFVANVAVEIAQNVRRLRHHASLALWCGNNEMEQGWAEWGWGRHAELDGLKAAYDRFFHGTLRQWIAAEDPDHAYWPSSPSSYGDPATDTPFDNPNGQVQGDAHYWDVWHGRKPFTAYRNQFPRFMSEFGFQALPPLETIRTYASEADWNMTSYIMDQHQKNDSGNSLMVGQMLDTFRLPKDFESLVYLSLVLQAEGIRYGVEHWRRHTDRVAGTLYWQLNDCWPVASWASLDYFGRWKALHYAAKRFYAPVLLSIEDAAPCQSIYLSSDLAEPWAGRVTWQLTTLAGEVLDAGEQAASVPPAGVTQVAALDFGRFLDVDSRRNLVFVAELWQGETRLALNAAFFVPTKHLDLVDPQIEAEVTVHDGVLAIKLSSQSLARLVEVSFSGADVVFSDNYFDLPAGKTVTVTAPLPKGWGVEQARAALRVRSVVETYSR